MSIEKAQKIMDHLEGREAPNRGLSGAIGRMQRREYNEVRQEIANLIDGKPAIEAKAPELSKTGAGDKVTPGTGSGAKAGDATGKATGGKKAQA